MMNALKNAQWQIAVRKNNEITGAHLLLHCFGAFDAEQGERADEFAKGDGGRGEKKRLAR